MTKNIEKLAAELFHHVIKKYPSKYQKWNFVAEDYKKIWREIANYVIIREQTKSDSEKEKR